MAHLGFFATTGFRTMTMATSGVRMSMDATMRSSEKSTTSFSIMRALTSATSWWIQAAGFQVRDSLSPLMA